VTFNPNDHAGRRVASLQWPDQQRNRRHRPPVSQQVYLRHLTGTLGDPISNQVVPALRLSQQVAPLPSRTREALHPATAIQIDAQTFATADRNPCRRWA
jgi:hypothetical protein